MTEVVPVEKTNVFERFKTGVSNGWNILKDTMGRMRDRLGIFGEETLAEVSVVTSPIVNGVRQVVENVKDSYTVIEGNIFKRLGNVMNEGWGAMKEKFSILKENVEMRVRKLKERGASEGVIGFVHEALDRVEELPIYINRKIAEFQDKKAKVVYQNAKKVFSGNPINQNRFDRLADTYCHIESRRGHFLNRAKELNEKLFKMREGRQRFAAELAVA